MTGLVQTWETKLETNTAWETKYRSLFLVQHRNEVRIKNRWRRQCGEGGRWRNSTASSSRLMETLAMRTRLTHRVWEHQVLCAFLLSCFRDNPCPPCCFSESSCPYTPFNGTKPLLFTGLGVQDHSGEVKGSFGVGKLRWVWPWEDAKGGNGEEHATCILSWRESAAVAELMLYLW